MYNIFCEIKKGLTPRFFILSCLGVVLVCCLSTGYISPDGSSYTIMELLFVSREALLTSTSLSRYEIWLQGIGIWTQLVLPFLLSIGYLYTVSTEQLTGFKRFMLIRENRLKYGVSKLIAAMVCGGIILFTGYIVFGILVFSRFPSIQEYPTGWLEGYLLNNPGFREGVFCMKRCAGIFLYGMCCNVFAYLVAIVFTDKYILMCLPIMLKYIYGQVLLKVEMDAWDVGKEKIGRICTILNLETVLRLDQSRDGILTLLFVLALYIIGFFLTLYLLKRQGEDFGYE